MTSGFRSLRRFNAAFADELPDEPDAGCAAPRRDAADAAPRATGEPASRRDHASTLGYRAAVRRRRAAAPSSRQRAIPGVESGRRPLRSGARVRAGALGADGRAGSRRASSPTRRASGSAFAPALGAGERRASIAAVRRWLDLDAAPDAIDATLADLPGAPGLRLPGSVDAFELAVRAVLGQQVTVAAARTLARRLVERFGAPLATPWPDVDRAFPGAATLLADVADRAHRRARHHPQPRRRDPGARPAPGTRSRRCSRRRATRALVERLCELPGIGPWTAHYIAMRALGWPDAFPPGDVAALKAMRQLFGTASQRDADAPAPKPGSRGARTRCCASGTPSEHTP